MCLLLKPRQRENTDLKGPGYVTCDGVRTLTSQLEQYVDRNFESRRVCWYRGLLALTLSVVRSS